MCVIQIRRLIMSKTISEPLFWLLCLKQFLSQVFNLSFCILSKVKVLSEPWEVWHLGYFLRLMPAPASVSDNYNRSQRKGRFPSLTLVWTKWRQAGRHAMVVDLAHPDCGLLSLSVVHPLCEQSQHREEGEHGGGGDSCHSAPHNLGVWREGWFCGTLRDT